MTLQYLIIMLSQLFFDVFLLCEIDVTIRWQLLFEKISPNLVFAICPFLLFLNHLKMRFLITFDHVLNQNFVI